MAGAAALDVLSLIQADLLDNPVRGDLVRGLGGIRKARCSNPVRGKGKRGGYRFLYLYLESRHHIHILYLLDKGEQEDLTKEERKALRLLVSQVRASRQRTSL
jgi:hypothetical protein